mmetsp:Transcript_5581/g.8287  ORF Transcript_5581/g.8287 Transcript_5581/m.8287 type:complete len:106 (-) Transcript_5581:485-802(-)
MVIVDEIRLKIEKRLISKHQLRVISIAELNLHNHKDSAWIAVDGYVYDITHHVLTHAGWECGCASSTLSAILRTLGTECTDEVKEFHSDQALQQLQGYMIGILDV